MATPLPPLVFTERQALVALSTLFASLTRSTEGGGAITIDSELAAALAVLTAALVVGGSALYRPGSLAAMTINPQGQLRVAPMDVVTARTVIGPWGDGSPWGGSGSPWQE